jgi:hypothetical protein
MIHYRSERGAVTIEPSPAGRHYNRARDVGVVLDRAR